MNSLTRAFSSSCEAPTDWLPLELLLWARVESTSPLSTRPPLTFYTQTRVERKGSSFLAKSFVSQWKRCASRMYLDCDKAAYSINRHVRHWCMHFRIDMFHLDCLRVRDGVSKSSVLWFFFKTLNDVPAQVEPSADNESDGLNLLGGKMQAMRLLGRRNVSAEQWTFETHVVFRCNSCSCSIDAFHQSRRTARTISLDLILLHWCMGEPQSLSKIISNSRLCCDSSGERTAAPP